MIDLEDMQACQYPEPPRPTVEARPENDDLPRAVADAGRQPIVDQAGAGHAGAARSRPAAIDDRTDASANWRQSRQGHHAAHRRWKHGPGERVMQQANASRSYRLQGPEKSHDLRRTTETVALHIDQQKSSSVGTCSSCSNAMPGTPKNCGAPLGAAIRRLSRQSSTAAPAPRSAARLPRSPPAATRSGGRPS